MRNHARHGPQSLLARLDAIGAALARREGALALLGLGSAGRETQRLDAHSDLDFFAIVAPGHKQRFLQTLDWLDEAHPVAWHFRNTADGHKALMADGVFCEFAVFEPQELAGIAFAPGRIVWRREGIDASIAEPRRPLPTATLPDETWLVGEALSCVFVGLQRWHRGERLSAARLVQSHAVDRLLELETLRAGPGAQDGFDRNRRAEQRLAGLAAELPELVPGYAHTPQAALAVLDALERRGAELPPSIAAEIRRLAAP